jgi:hypothetical protein
VTAAQSGLQTGRLSRELTNDIAVCRDPGQHGLPGVAEKHAKPDTPSAISAEAVTLDSFRKR